MALFKKPQKGMNCHPTNEGKFECERTVRDDKTEEILGTGQKATIAVDPSTCKPRFDDFNVMDEDMGAFDGIAERAVSGCKRKSGA